MVNFMMSKELLEQYQFESLPNLTSTVFNFLAYVDTNLNYLRFAKGLKKSKILIDLELQHSRDLIEQYLQVKTIYLQRKKANSITQ